jgi:carbon monoxide dehydrogenase subunit G
MSGFTLTEWLDHTPATIFHFSLDPANAPKVVAGVTKLEQLSPGTMSVGTRFRETRVVNGKEAEAEMVLTRYDPPHGYTMSAELKGITVTYSYSFIPENGGTRVTLVCNVTASGLRKLFAPVVAAVMKKEDSTHLQNLKQVMSEMA